MRRAPLLRRILGCTARASLVLLLALAALVLATFVGANLPWVRSWLAREAGALASRQIAGTLTITEIGHIGLFSVSGVDAQLTDGAGRRVLAVSGLAAELDALRAARSWFGEGPLELAGVRVAADELSADLRADGSGELPLIRALEPRPSAPSAKPSRAPKPTELEIDSLTMRAIRIRGAAGMLPERPQGDLEVELRNLSGRGRLDSDTLELELGHVGAEARNLPLVGTLAGEVAGTVTLLRGGEPSAALAAEARWHGSLAQIPVDAAFVFAGRRLSGFVRSEAPAGAVMQLWPEGGWSHELGDEEPVDVLLAFEGPLDALALRAVIDSSGGELYVDGRVDLERLSGHGSVIGDDLDLGRWLASAPTTSVRFVAALAVEREEGALTGRLALRGRPGSINGQPLPELALSARLRPRSLDARLNAQLPGADVVLIVAVPLGASRANDPIALELQAEVSDLARALAPLDVRANLAGRGTLRARGRLELGDEPRLSDAHLRAELRALEGGGARATRASIEAAARGPLDRLRFELRLDARRLSLANYRLDRLRARAEGGAEQLRLQADIAPAGASPFVLTARLSPAARTLSDVALDAGSGRDAVRISARAARITDHGYAVDGLVVHSGSGELLLDGALRGDALHVNARASAFSAAAVARRLGLDLALPEGIADLSLQFEQRAGRVSGTLSGSVSELGVGPLQGGTLQVDLVAERGVLRGQAGLSAAPLGQARLRVDELELPERWRASALASLKGRVDLLARADLGRLARIERLAALAGGATLGGTLEARLELRGDGRTEPSAKLALTTRELVWSLPPAAAPDDIALLRTGQLPRVWQGIDLELRLDLGDSELQAHAALVGEERSLLAGLQGSLRMPLARLLRDPASVDAGALPVDVRLYVPERELDDFPALLRFAGVDGVLRADVSARGPLGRPELLAHLELAELRLESSRRALPLTIVADGRLDGDRVSASAAIRDQRRPLVSLAAAASLGSSAGAPFHDAEIDLRSNGLPLDALGALLGQDVTGDLYGALSVRTDEGAPAAKGTLWVNAPSYRGFRQKQARWVLDAGAEAFSTELMLEQHGGGARLTLSGPWRWEGAALPSVDRRRLRATLRAERFELRAIEPLLPEQARGVGGRLDADVALDPSRPGSARGSARLREGRVYVAALGQEFRDIALDARLDESVISIERLSARALDGRVNAHGEVALEGLAFRGAELDVNIPRGDPLPIALEGVTVATAWGRLDVSARGESGKTGEAPLLNVNVRVPRLEVVLPRLNPHSVQQLADDPTIETGTFVGPHRFTALPLPPYEGEADPGPPETALVVHMNVELGEEVWLQREPELELKVVGGVELELRDELSLDGQLRLARGNIEVQGRTFRIERGEVTFQPDRAPSNPTVVATGVYTAPEGTRVYAEFVGPVETGELTLRSEPPLRDDQILSLLLFGSSDGSFGSTTGDGAGDPLDSVGGTALVAGGNVVARGLNAELRRLTSLDIQTRIGSREGEPQPEVAVQLTPRVTAELAYRLEAPTPGRAPDRTYLTLDLRLFRNWSLSTTIGDAGSFVLDLLWRYRY